MHPHRAYIAKILAGLALALGALSGAAAADANVYPNKPVTIVAGFPPGTATDSVARVLAERLGARLNGTFIVDNKPGQGGSIGAAAVAKSRADGYTLLMGTSGTHAINMTLYKKPGYDAVKDFAPISPVSHAVNLLVVNPARVKATTVKELIDYAKLNPGKLMLASSGSGTTIHLAEKCSRP